MPFVIGQPWQVVPQVMGYIGPLIATSCAQYPLLQFLCRCSLFDFSGVRWVKICAYWNLLLEKIIFMKTWKENHIFLLHSKENKCGIISKLFVSPIHPETKGTNIMLYSVTNDVKVGIPLWRERWLQEHSEKAVQFCTLYNICVHGKNSNCVSM